VGSQDLADSVPAPGDSLSSVDGGSRTWVLSEGMRSYDELASPCGPSKARLFIPYHQEGASSSKDTPASGCDRPETVKVSSIKPFGCLT
jgi:hypothetical protein